MLGDRIQATALDVLEGLIEGTYTKSRERLLGRVNLAIEKLRFLVRLSVDLRCMDKRRYEFAARNLDEIGRQVGGWTKANRAAPFRDRVVHHALCAVIEPMFERGFVFESYANRVGQGGTPGGGPLREFPRPPSSRAALRYLSLLPGHRP